jgi:hypothetical protein
MAILELHPPLLIISQQRSVPLSSLPYKDLCHLLPPPLKNPNNPHTSHNHTPLPPPTPRNLASHKRHLRQHLLLMRRNLAKRIIDPIPPLPDLPALLRILPIQAGE